MARFVTKNLTPAELRTAGKELKASLKALQGSKKVNAKAATDLAAVRDRAIAEAKKALGVAQKAHDSAVAAANKVFEREQAKVTKEGAKIDVQIAAHEAKIKQVEEAQATNKAPAEATA